MKQFLIAINKRIIRLLKYNNPGIAGVHRKKGLFRKECYL